LEKLSKKMKLGLESIDLKLQIRLQTNLYQIMGQEMKKVKTKRFITEKSKNLRRATSLLKKSLNIFSRFRLRSIRLRIEI